MTEPGTGSNAVLIAVMVVVQTMHRPLVALASLYLVALPLHISFQHSPSTLAVIITLPVPGVLTPAAARSRCTAVLAPGGDLSSSVVGRWVVLVGVLLIIGHFTDAIALYPPPRPTSVGAGDAAALVRDHP